MKFSLHIADVKNNTLRRLALVAVFLPLLLFVAVSWLVGLPLLGLLRGVVSIAEDVWDFAKDTWRQCGAQVLLTRRMIALMWDSRFHTDPDAAMAAAKKVGARKAS